MQWLFLAIAILAEVVATASLKASEGFDRWPFVVASFAGYAVAFYFLSLVIERMPVGVAYAVWAGVGVTLITVVGAFAFDQKLDAYAYLGIGLIVAGVVVLIGFSSSVAH